MVSLEEITNVNTEIRYITLELMKIAAQKGVKFDKIAKEYLQNAYLLHDMIYNGKEEKGTKKKQRQQQ